MNLIYQRISQARRRLMLRRFLSATAWLLFAMLLLAAVAIAIPKLWPIEFLQTTAAADTWTLGWLGGAMGLAIVGGLLYAWLRRCSSLDAALEVDQRFRLNERVSSALTLGEADSKSGAGRALIDDVSRRVEAIEIRDEFSLRPGRWAFLPLVPLALILVFVLFRNVVSESSAEANQTPTKIQKKLKAATQKTQVKLQKKQKELAESGLKEAADLFSVIGKKLDEFQKSDLNNRKESLIKLNDIKAEIEARKNALGDAATLKKELKRMETSNSGAAKELADSLRDGDMKQARSAIKEMIEKLKRGDLSDRERNELANEMGQMAQTLKDAKDRFEESKSKLDSEIERAKANGDAEQAAKLQARRDELGKQENQFNQLGDLAEKLQQSADQLGNSKSPPNQDDCQSPEADPSSQPNQGGKPQKSSEPQEGGNSNSEKPSDGSSDQGSQSNAEGSPRPTSKPGDKSPSNGNPTQGAQADSSSPPSSFSKEQIENAMKSLDELSDQLQSMESTMDQLDSLQELSEQIGQCKGMLNGQMAENAESWKESKQGGPGPGGSGERGISESETGLYESQVRAKVKKGETVVVGDADGPNVAGISREEAKKRIESSKAMDADALESQRFTKSQREHAREYFQKIRGN